MSIMPSSSRFECPCCGYPTLTEQTASAICVLCDWAYGQSDSETSHGECSFAEARRNFASHLTFRRPDDLPSFTLETNPEVTAAKQNALIAFQQWRAEVNPGMQETLWTAVESALHQLQRTRETEDAFGWTDDYDVVMALVGLVEDRYHTDSAGATALSQPQHTILNVQAFDAEVSNGGFHQLFSNSTGDYSQEILTALKEIGALKAAHLLEQAFAVFPNSQAPRSQAERVSLLEEAGQDLLNRLAELDEMYFSSEENIYSLAAKYCRNHESEFK